MNRKGKQTAYEEAKQRQTGTRMGRAGRKNKEEKIWQRNKEREKCTKC